LSFIFLACNKKASACGEALLLLVAGYLASKVSKASKGKGLKEIHN
jgi:hypothetical protein